MKDQHQGNDMVNPSLENTSMVKETSKISFLKVLSGSLLISGTCIGAGMLALPVVTGLAGFVPALLISFLCYLFMMATGFLFLEATLWMPEESNLLSMAKHFLGRKGELIGGGFFIFLYYCLMVAYFAAGTPLFLSVVNIYAPWSLTHHEGVILMGIFFGTIVFLGRKSVDRVNWILMVGLILSFIFLMGAGSSHIETSFLLRKNWSLTFLAAPILFAAYGFHNIIPSVVSYLHKDVKSLRYALFIGTTIPFIAYSLWQAMAMGLVTEEMFSEASLHGKSISQVMQDVTGNPWIGTFALYFGFFALVTSLLGVSLSMVDFLRDGVSLHFKSRHRLLICLLVFIPPMILSWIYPTIFIEALGVAGGFGEAVLNGLFPIAMVWAGRYTMKKSSDIALFGGKKLLVFLYVATFAIIILEALHVTGLI